MKLPKLTYSALIKKLNLLLYYICRVIKVNKRAMSYFMFVAISGRIGLQDINNFCGGSTTDWVKESEK